MNEFHVEKTTTYNQKDVPDTNSYCTGTTEYNVKSDDVHIEELPTYNNKKLKDTNSKLD